MAEGDERRARIIAQQAAREAETGRTGPPTKPRSNWAASPPVKPRRQPSMRPPKKTEVNEPKSTEPEAAPRRPR
jgi:hypothetical protein